MNGPSEQGVGKSDVDSTSIFTSGRSVSRRALLKGVAGGSTLVAVARPIETLATPTVVTLIGPNSALAGLRCTLSGMQSTGTSVRPATTTCGGLSPGYFTTAGPASQFARWPGYSPGTAPGDPGTATASFSIGTGYTHMSTVRSLFSASTLSSTLTLYDLMKNAATDESHWLAAMFVALRGLGTNFPYTAVQIKALYDNPATRTPAIAFFRGLEHAV